MAQRRMFSKKITDTDMFLDMPMTAQCLYFHLNLEADDDGFIGNAKTIRRKIGASEDDLKLLLGKNFIIPFETGVVVIKDWKIHNYIRKDTYNETIYSKEKKSLAEDVNGAYTLRTPLVDVTSPQVRLGKDSIGKDNKESMPVSDETDLTPSVKYSNEHLRLAEKIRDNLKTEFSKEMKNAKVNRWADAIRLLEERDEQSLEAIEFVIDWLPTNEFWFGNIRSGATLRKKFEKLKHEIRLEKEKAKKAANNRYGKPIREEPLPDWAKKELEGQSDEIEAETVTSDEPSDSGELKKRIEALNRRKTR